MKRNLDSFYTPPDVAAILVQKCQSPNPSSIADFAGGNGALLLAAARRYPSSELYFNDISKECVNLNRDNPKWRVTDYDFLEPEGLENFSAECDVDAGFDIILLNPPFSQRGGAYTKVVFEGMHLKCSTALAFIINSLNFIKECGELVAIVPSSCITSEKDHLARVTLLKKYEIEIGERLSNRTFSNCSVNTVCIRITKNRRPTLDRTNSVALTVNSKGLLHGSVRIFRGKLSVSESKRYKDLEGYQFIHTTNMRDGEIGGTKVFLNKPNSSISGPCILLPRVCKPSSSKVILHFDDTPIVLSDCVIAIFPNENIDIKQLFTLITSHWNQLQSLYTGTCAQYITLKKLGEFFVVHLIDYEVVEVNNGLFRDKSHSEVLLNIRDSPRTLQIGRPSYGT